MTPRGSPGSRPGLGCVFSSCCTQNLASCGQWLRSDTYNVGCILGMGASGGCKLVTKACMKYEQNVPRCEDCISSIERTTGKFVGYCFGITTGLKPKVTEIVWCWPLRPPIGKITQFFADPQAHPQIKIIVSLFTLHVSNPEL